MARRLLSHGFVAVLAIAVAAAGTAAAGGGLVTTKNIQNGTIQLKDIAKKAQKELRGKRGATGPQGPQGDAGPAGPAGPAGQDGINGAPGAAGTSGSTAPALILGSRGLNPGDVAWTSPFGSNSGDEAGATVPVPEGTGLIARDFTVTLTEPPTAGDSVTVTLRLNGVNSALSCTVENTATTCSPPGSPTLNLAAPATLSMRADATAGVPVGTKAGWGFRVVF